jgi:hypothetical protein
MGQRGFLGGPANIEMSPEARKRAEKRAEKRRNAQTITRDEYYARLGRPVPGTDPTESEHEAA